MTLQAHNSEKGYNLYIKKKMGQLFFNEESVLSADLPADQILLLSG